DSTGGKIDEICRGFHCLKYILSDYPARSGRKRSEGNQKIQLSSHIREIVAMNHAIEPVRSTWARADADDFHAKRFADRRQMFRNQTHAQDPNSLACQKLRRPAFPS